MLSGSDLNQYTDKSIYFKTSNGSYLKVEDISEGNSSPLFILTQNRNYATEFILIKKTETNVSIRLNSDMKNQNGTFGYHLYVIPENDIVYGAGNDELFAQFNIERHAQYIYIKSAYKNAYFCHEYNILRCRSQNNLCSFTIEEAHIPFVQRSVCVISYGYMRIPVDLNTSPIINTLKEIYPQTSIDIFMFLPEVMDEFCNVTYDISTITSPRCIVSIVTHKNDVKYFIKTAQSYGLPVVSNKNKSKIYSYRTMSTIWNITEAVRNIIASKKVYNTYILMRNDMYAYTRIFKKLLDTNKLYCLVNDRIDSHLFIGKDVLLLNYLYDYYVRNKMTYSEEPVEKIIYDFLISHNTSLGNIHYLIPFVNYPSNMKKFDDSFYKTVSTKYQEVTGNIMDQKYK